jgi:hypothetical protein
MKKFIAELKSLTPYGQGKMHLEPKLPQELNDAYAERTWRARTHSAAGELYIPPMAFKLLLEATAKYLGDQIPGQGKRTYTAKYRQGVIIPDPVMLGIHVEDIGYQKIFTSAGGGQSRHETRVWRYFPVIEQWAGILTILAIDDIFTADVVEKHLHQGGKIVGIGVWRPENGGMWGKFDVTSFEEVAI